MSITQSDDGKKVLGTIRELVGMISGFAALLVGLGACAGLIGGWYVLNYRTGLTEIGLKNLADAQSVQAASANDRWVQLAVLQTDMITLKDQSSRIENKLDQLNKNNP